MQVGAVRNCWYLLKDIEVKLLDCTIRDGGYLNEWKFSDQEVIDAYQSASDVNEYLRWFNVMKNSLKINGMVVKKKILKI